MPDPSDVPGYPEAGLLPTSTIQVYMQATGSPPDDKPLADGDRIPIEERQAKEITHMGPTRLAPEGVKVWNPAFDITPHRYIAGIITERGVLRPPFSESLRG